MSHMSHMIWLIFTNLDYTTENGKVTVEGRVIENSEWDDDKYCWRIAPTDVAQFLGHKEAEYAVSDLFSKIKNPWYVEAQLQGDDVEH